MTRTAIVLSGRDADAESLCRWLSSATTIYAADGGANRCVDLGFHPIVVGDMDSFEPVDEWLEIRSSDDQETTDFEKVIRAAVEDGVTQAVVLGLEGDRLDHVLASISTLVSAPLELRVVLRSGWATVLRSGAKWIAKDASGFSLIPLPSCIATIEGAEWNLASANLNLGEKVSISNFSKPGATIRIESGAALLISHGADEPWEWNWKPIV